MPVLAFKHYDAIERRMHKLMTYILECMDKLPSGEVIKIIQPEYHNLNILTPLPDEDIDAIDSNDTVNKHY